jgi:hypothetical protein
MCAGASALDKRLSASTRAVPSLRVACGPGRSPDYSPKRSGPHQALGCRCRKRQEADVVAAPAWMLKRRALIAASHAPSALAQQVARRIGAPQDDRRRKRYRYLMPAALAVHPPPTTRALQLPERRPRARARFVLRSGLPIGQIPHGQVMGLATHTASQMAAQRGFQLLDLVLK